MPTSRPPTTKLNTSQPDHLFLRTVCVVQLICIFWLMLPSPRQNLLHFCLRRVLLNLQTYLYKLHMHHIMHFKHHQCIRNSQLCHSTSNAISLSNHNTIINHPLRKYNHKLQGNKFTSNTLRKKHKDTSYQ